MHSNFDNLDPALAAVLDRIRTKQPTSPEDAELLEHHLVNDSMVPEVRNRASWTQHARNHGNAGVWVHTDLDNFGAVNKTEGEDAGDAAIKTFGTALAAAGKPLGARVFRRGGDEFSAWFLRPEDAQVFATQMSRHPQAASYGIGWGRLQAEGAMRRAKEQKTETPGSRVVSTLDQPPPLAWQSAEESLKNLRRQELGAPAPVEKSEGAPPAKPPVGQHPVLTGQPFAMLSGEEPRFASREGGHEALRQELQGRGHRFEEIQGFYGKPERSFVVHGLPFAEARELGKEFGQESVIHSDGTDPVLLYTNGQHADHYHPTRGWNVSPTPPKDGWSRLVDPATRQPIYASLDIDWGTKHSVRRLGHASTANAYDWHDDGTEGLEPLKKADNDQAPGGRVSTFGPTTAAWGASQPGRATNLRHYDFRPFASHIEDMAKKHGYEFKYMGPGNVPDLKKDNYNNRSLHIWDPKAGSGGDFGEERYTDTWRKAHELAHAMTYADINAKYGEGRRIGKLGHHRTPHEAKRAVEWEDMTVHKQREIAAQMGHHISDEDFHRERNTVLADAVHRARFGTFVEPAAEGFVPHSYHVPLQTAFDSIDAHAKEMGLGEHDTLKTKAPPLVAAQ